MDKSHSALIKDAGLRVTLPRLKVLELLQSPNTKHVAAEDIYKRLTDFGEDVGLATIYHILSQFHDAGIVSRHHVDNGKSVFELSHVEHHDHLICLTCGKVIEFLDPIIEDRQHAIARQHNITLTNHSLSLYGHCQSPLCNKS
ncbi:MULTISPECIES: ferric iron uptake transcriptional regulator [Vibrio]|uniref:ferric iron uptake transcriptional regulator n=1 Tax=Vibrio TaxID=662 RepID=UPI00058727DB|nr:MULTISPECIES: ferric iron uptake transcriptional regulator [Vibrio]MDE3898575.1 ferric iron uptake transcriptional regulator [Vibrio sp. CC007]